MNISKFDLQKAKFMAKYKSVHLRIESMLSYDFFI